ncbi:hypothetical protein AU476_07085 [Cupriavidus sp. UYMSc13B]|nr:hypothetical protein AU476_07085 [Cupriavidus sp. UYMSc13B]
MLKAGPKDRPFLFEGWRPLLFFPRLQLRLQHRQVRHISLQFRPPLLGDAITRPLPSTSSAVMARAIIRLRRIGRNERILLSMPRSRSRSTRLRTVDGLDWTSLST